MISCVAKENLYQDTTMHAKVMLLATYYQAIDYTRCIMVSSFLFKSCQNIQTGIFMS
jgi:hypothetical protein